MNIDLRLFLTVPRLNEYPGAQVLNRQIFPPAVQQFPFFRQQVNRFFIALGCIGAPGLDQQ